MNQSQRNYFRERIVENVDSILELFYDDYDSFTMNYWKQNRSSREDRFVLPKLPLPKNIRLGYGVRRNHTDDPRIRLNELEEDLTSSEIFQLIKDGKVGVLDPNDDFGTNNLVLTDEFGKNVKLSKAAKKNRSERLAIAAKLAAYPARRAAFMRLRAAAQKSMDEVMLADEDGAMKAIEDLASKVDSIKANF